MRTRIVCLAAILCLFAAGCFVPSLHPLYNSSDVAFDPALVGKWADEDSKETWVFTQQGNHAYRLEYTDENGPPGAFAVRLVELEGMRFLDFYPELPDSGTNDTWGMHLLGVHTIAHLKQVEPVLQFAILDPDSGEALLKLKPDAIPHDSIDNHILVTASADWLRRFIPAHVTEERLFGEYSALTRVD
jgi:hypothetical protein